MTTQKQVATNKKNARKSTGPKSAQGKATVAMNAISHGVLSQKLFLAGEDPAEFAALLDDLSRALRPIGTLEQVLVEKIAVALWKQRRLVTAETASIELARTKGSGSRCLAINDAMGIAYPDKEVTAEELEPIGEDDQFQWVWGKAVIAELSSLDDAVLDNNDLAAMENAALRFSRQRDR